MKYTNVQIGIAFAVVLAVLGSVATGQVRPIGGGQALDASLQIGSGGVNYAVPQNYTPNTGISSLTQSRGLSAFQGRAPSISNQLSLSVHTDGIDRFRQQSVSVQDAVQGGPGLYDPQTTMYNSALTTYLRPSDIVKAGYGRRVPIPGASPASKNVQLAENLFVDATADFKPIMPTDVNEMMVGNALGLPRTEGGAPDASRQWVTSLDSRQLAERGGRDLFGMLRQEDRTNLAKEISDFDKADEASGALDLSVKPIEEVKPVEPIDARVKATDLTERLEGPAGKMETPLQPQPTQMEIAQTPGKLQTDPNTGLPKENADPFFDMLVKLRQRQLPEGTPPAEGAEGAFPNVLEGQTPPTPQPKGQTAADQTTAPRPALHPMDEAVLQRMKTAVPTARPQSVELTADNKIILHRLAGESDDTFNRYMRRAESDMKARRFYEAARQYSLASMARPTNPMSHTGGCLANFAAEEWLTSARNLQTAMELFPPLMEARLDLKKLIPIENWPTRLDLMEQWVEKMKDQPPLVFLAAFIELNYGREDQAKQYAQTLLQFRDPPKILHAYAQYVLTGKVPARTKTPRRDASSADNKSEEERE